jgi:hypothetical protein
VENGSLTGFQITDGGLVEARSLVATDDGLWWSHLQGAGAYDVVRIGVTALRGSGGDYSDPSVTQACVADDLSGTWYSFGSLPPSGEGYLYAVRGQPAGSYDDTNPFRVGSRDAGIAASGNDCP